MFKLKFFLIPIATRNIVINSTPFQQIGYKDVYIFGIRIARFQKTEPWNN